MTNFEINLSFDGKIIETGICLKQNDFGNFTFIITPDFEFNDAVFKFKLPSSKIIATSNYDFSDNIVYTIENSVLSEFGIIECEISFYDDGKRFTSNKFTFEVLEEIGTTKAVEAHNNFPVLDTLINKTYDLNNKTNLTMDRATELEYIANEDVKTTKFIKLAKHLFSSHPSTLSEGNFVKCKNIGYKNYLKIYGNSSNENSKLIASNGGNMLKFLSINTNKTDVTDDFYEINDNKVFAKNIIASLVDDVQLQGWFDIEPITFYKNIPYTSYADRLSSSLYPYLILYDENGTLVKQVSRHSVITFDEDKTISLIRIWGDLNHSSMSNYTKNGLVDCGIYLGSHLQDDVIDNELEIKQEISLPTIEENDYIYADNYIANKVIDGNITDISETDLGKTLIDLQPIKDYYYFYSTQNLDLEVSCFMTIMDYVSSLNTISPMMFSAPAFANSLSQNTELSEEEIIALGPKD